MSKTLPFGEFAGEYDAARPAYPPAALAWLLEGQTGVVVDLGAGSGKLTEALATRCQTVVAIEPDDDMRAQLTRRVPGVSAVSGTAEALPLADASVGTVLVAQAWHWFDPASALREISRVVVPGGRLGLAWNAPAPATDWQRELLAAGPQLSPVNERWWPNGLPRVGTESRIDFWEQLMTPQEVCLEHSTHLAVRNLEPARRQRYLADVASIATRESEDSRTETIPYRRMTWCARHRIAPVAE